MRIIRASEIATYLYCQRAWWYDRQGYESQNLAELAAGSELHEQHGRAALAVGCVKVLAYVLLLAAVVLLSMYAVQKFAAL
jgi:CRISPR/Cas system-associated exonuclease Cas4 (RecB family)